jgi:hypothetical protein
MTTLREVLDMADLWAADAIEHQKRWRLPCSHPNAVKAFQNDILKSSIDLIDCMMRGKPAERHIAATNAARRAGGHTPGDHHPWWNTPLGKACEEALNA